MITIYPITRTQHALFREADLAAQHAKAQLDLIGRAVLAGHDITAGHIAAMTETTITVDTPDDPPDAATMT